MDRLWVALIAGAYVALWASMLITAGTYLWRWFRLRDRMDIGTALLFLGIGLSFLGHGFDQTLWAASNIERATRDDEHLALSAWYAREIPLAVICGKWFASSGAFIHLHLAWHSSPGDWWATFWRISALWGSLMLFVAALVY